MRTLAKSLLAALIITTFAFAGQRPVDTEKVTKNFLKGLNHENQGVVESTIRVVVLMKIKYPNADYDEIIDKLEELIMEGPNKNIRIKALIASDYLNNFEQYNWLKNGNYDEGDQLFDIYLSKMSLNRIANTN